jgi:hypothetical protein
MLWNLFANYLLVHGSRQHMGRYGGGSYDSSQTRCYRCNRYSNWGSVYSCNVVDG